MPVDPKRARDSGLPRAPGALGAAEACREVITAYFHLSDADEFDSLGTLLTDDVELGHGATTIRGREAVVDILRSRHRSTPARRTLHHLGSVQMLAVGEREATSHAVLAFYDWQHVEGSRADPQLVGFFETKDEYALGDDGRWRLRRHRAERAG